MPTIQCPHCKHEARVASLETISGKNVKCPSCNQTFYVEPPAAEQPNVGADDFGFRGPAPEFSPPTISPPAPQRPKRAESLFNPLTYDPNGETSAKRYPNLLRYIAISETLITIIFKISMVLLVIGFVLVELGSIFQIGQFGVLMTLVNMVVLALIFALAALFQWLWFIFYMAATEFVRVVIDIEDNTRA